jgi:hypothetical protein
VTWRPWRAHGPQSPVRLPCGHVISLRSAETIYELALAEATDAGLTEDPPDAACPLCREPWLLPDSLPLATDVIRAAVERRRQSLAESMSQPAKRRSRSPSPSDRPLTRARTALFTASPPYHPSPTATTPRPRGRNRAAVLARAHRTMQLNRSGEAEAIVAEHSPPPTTAAASSHPATATPPSARYRPRRDPLPEQVIPQATPLGSRPPPSAADVHRPATRQRTQLDRSQEAPRTPVALPQAEAPAAYPSPVPTTSTGSPSVTAPPATPPVEHSVDAGSAHSSDDPPQAARAQQKTRRRRVSFNMAANRQVIFDPDGSLVVAEQVLRDLGLSPTSPPPRNSPRPETVPRFPPHSQWLAPRARASTVHNALQRTRADLRGQPATSSSGASSRPNSHSSAAPTPPTPDAEHLSGPDIGTPSLRLSGP